MQIQYSIKKTYEIIGITAFFSAIARLSKENSTLWEGRQTSVSLRYIVRCICNIGVSANLWAAFD